MNKYNKGFSHVFLLILIVVAVAAVGIYVYWDDLTGTKTATPAAESPEAGLGAEVYEKAQSTTANSVPKTNPFEAKINPFE